MTVSNNALHATFPFDDKRRAPRILVVGDIMLDRYWYGHTSRVSPEAPVPVVQVDHEESRPGGAANVALNLRHLGAEVTLIGICGNDANGQTLKQQLNQEGIHCLFVTAEHIATITKLRVIAQNQQLVRTDFEQSTMSNEDILGQLSQQFEAALTTTDAVILSDYGKGCLRPAQPYIQRCRTAGIPIIVDPKGNDWSHYSGATVITPNFKEFIEVGGTAHSENDITENAHQLISQLDLNALLVTRELRACP